MASTSASFIQKSFKYDVFLSFRGEDTRKNFVDHLYHALQQKSINTYKDDEEIKKGKRIDNELTRSIEDSKFYIIVFSKDYASSSWCLDELVKIMECQKTMEQTAYPIFYDVEPTEVRKQTGAVGKAFAKHKEKEAVGKWRAALREAADLAGWELKNTLDGHEAKFIQKIVEEISLELRFINSRIDGKLIGMETRVKDVVSSLETNINDVRMIGIKGIGGGGKTTLAEAVFVQISNWFEGKSFVENVREVSKGSSYGLKLLQKQVLSDMLNDPNITISSVHEGKAMMKKTMCARKVLVVLDDVDHIDQLEALAGEIDWFKSGSRVIITTRDEQVLIAHGVNLILDVNLLSHNEALCLFSRHAFGTEFPIQGYDELSKQVVRYAAGLPLTIRVLGSFLCGKDTLEWVDALERLKTIPLRETLQILELSYYSLEEDYKEIFLDVVCILKGWKKEKAIRVLESCGFHARSGLRVLQQKSLITVSVSGCLGMHDHIEEMGKNIVRRLHPDEPFKHSRLWIEEEIQDILAEDKGTESTRCLQVKLADLVCVMKDTGYSNNAYDYSYLDYDAIGEDWQYLPDDLRYLCLNGYPCKSLPMHFEAKNLVGLEIFFSKIDQLWKGGERKVLKKLRFLDLCFCKLRSLDLGPFLNLERLNLVACKNSEELQLPIERLMLKHLSLRSVKLRTLDLTRAQNLGTLKVEKCEDLVELHMPVEGIMLEHLSLLCLKLKTLNLTRSQNIETLDIKACESLEELHMPFENFKLKSFNLCHSKMKILDIGWAKHLDKLSIHDNNDLVELHLPIEKLKCLFLRCATLKILNLTRTRNLEQLDLVECEDLLEVCMPLVSPELTNIYIRSSKLRTLDFTRVQNLEKLVLLECWDLQELYMPTESPMLKNISIRRSKMRTLILTQTRNLERLSILECKDLQELHMPVESPELKIIDIRNSKLRTFNLTGAVNLNTLDLDRCEVLLELHMPIESSKLKGIRILQSKLKTLNLRRTWNLERLNLEKCEDLLEIHMPTEGPKLKTIELSCSKLIILNLNGTQNLEILKLNQCEDLLELHMPIKSPKLRTIHICCPKLRTFDLTKTRSLEKLHLQQCDHLLELHLPAESPMLGTISVCSSKLRTLNLSGTWNLKRIDLVQCEDLLELHMPNESLKLKTINIHGAKLRTLHLGLSPELKQLDLPDCFNLVEIHAPIGCLSGCVKFKPPMLGGLTELHLIGRSVGICPLHPDNNLPKFHFECIYKEFIPPSTGNLEKLISFGLCACTNLAGLSGTICGLQSLRKLTLEGSIPEVPKDLDRLECLEELSLLSTEMERLPDVICMLKHLKILQITSCWNLKQLPTDLGKLECLEELRVTDCTSLRDIPNSICEMRRLKCFHLRNCTFVKKLPEEIGRLKCLEELSIEGTCIIDLPLSIFELEDLVFFL